MYNTKLAGGSADREQLLRIQRELNEKYENEQPPASSAYTQEAAVAVAAASGVVLPQAGAAGQAAAAGAGARVTILEQNGELGKKILSTGNGKCNFTNIRQMPGAYRGEHPDFAMEVISRFPVPETIRFFLEMGLYSKNRDGYLYPHSEQAQAVRDVLVMELKRLQVKVETNVFAEKITKGARFHITAKRYLQRPEKKSKKRTVLVRRGTDL